MNSKLNRLLSITWCMGVLFPLSVFAQETVETVSPDGRIKMSVTVKSLGAPYEPGPRLYYSVSYRGNPVILDSPMALWFQEAPACGPGDMIMLIEQKYIRDAWDTTGGKSSHVLDHYQETQIWLKHAPPSRVRYKMALRAYNDGVAFRHVLLPEGASQDFNVTQEKTWFRFTADHTVWAADYSTFKSSQETEFGQKRLSTIAPNSVHGLPVLVQTPKAWVAITEASLADWAGMYVQGVENVPNTLCTRLAPHPTDSGVCVTARAPHKSPWRVILLADHPGRFIESNTILNLNEPCAIADPSWIKPGKCAWDWWWSGSYAPDASFEMGANQDTMKYFIDFASEMGWEYQLVDWQWYGPPFADGVGGPAHPTSDITTNNPNIDVPALVQYAKAKNVRLFVWAHWEHIDQQMNEAFPLYEKWGVAGVKIDFMDRDDQGMVNFYHRVTKKAAEHHLLIDLHGAYKPTGIRRTYPNLLTREGVMGNEYNKWSDRVTPDHCLVLPFTRMIAGPMDFTPGGFRHADKASFKIVPEPGPMVYGTRAFQLAMLVVYESPLQVLCDTPYAYRQSPEGLDFLKLVPTTWNETRVINGQVGNYITVARRSGRDWYIGVMTDWTARSLTLPLTYLGTGRFAAQIWRDAEPNESNLLVRSSRHITARDTLQVDLRSGGGCVIRLTPNPESAP
ncbi:MAG: glycoside hydrolase family 97 protein [Planctomycetes bacterium]|nr:glycoside hydrolase family 97 protein [Planctomycetota bacterium]